MTTIEFEVVDGPAITLRNPRVVVAGYTGADRDAVQHHIDELARIGVPPPASVPSYFPLETSLLTQSDEVEVDGALTSGEVEPVLVRAAGQLYLTVGSDHTDREIETRDILASKAACPKPVGRRAISLDAAGDWAAGTLRCRVDGAVYQDGPLALLRPTPEVLEEYLARDPIDGDLVIFGGTVPLLDGEFVAGQRWDMELELAGETLSLSYRAARTMDKEA